MCLRHELHIKNAPTFCLFTTNNRPFAAIAIVKVITYLHVGVLKETILFLYTGGYIIDTTHDFYYKAEVE
jgi:hypothetical protein